MSKLLDDFNNKKMSEEDSSTLDRILNSYTNEEFAKVVAELCHGKENTEIKNIIECLQNELYFREN